MPVPGTGPRSEMALSVHSQDTVQSGMVGSMQCFRASHPSLQTCSPLPGNASIGLTGAPENRLQRTGKDTANRKSSRGLDPKSATELGIGLFLIVVATMVAISGGTTYREAPDSNPARAVPSLTNVVGR